MSKLEYSITKSGYYSDFCTIFMHLWLFILHHKFNEKKRDPQ